MKTLTLHQPWATLVALEVKTIETRSWSTKYRGRLAIHAGKRRPEDGYGGSRWQCPRGTGTLVLANDPLRTAYRMPLGAIVATCDLVDVLPITGMNEEGHDEFVCPDIGGGLTLYRFGHGGAHPATVEDDITRQLPYGDFTVGRFAWILERIVPCAPPIPAVGHQGLWEWSG